MGEGGGRVGLKERRIKIRDNSFANVAIELEAAEIDKGKEGTP